MDAGTRLARYKPPPPPERVSTPVLLQALNAAEVAAFPSYTETFGLAAVEAMACGCPTVYTKRSCGPEIVRDGVTGLLVEH